MLKKTIYGNELFKKEGFRPPRFYGLAYRKVNHFAEVYYIFPLYLFIRMIKWLIAKSVYRQIK